MIHFFWFGVKKYYTLFLLILPLTMTANNRMLSNSKNDSIISQTNKLVSLDQKYRWYIMLGLTDSSELSIYMNGEYSIRMKRIQDNYNHLINFDTTKMNQIINMQNKIDSNNIFQIKKILLENGVIDNNDFISNLNILLLHFDIIDLEEVLPKLYEAVISKRYSPKYYAENHDRLMELKKQNLVY